MIKDLTSALLLPYVCLVDKKRLKIQPTDNIHLNVTYSELSLKSWKTTLGLIIYFKNKRISGHPTISSTLTRN